MIQGLRRGGSMSRKPRVDRTPEEKWQIIQEGMESGNVSETCRRHGIAQTLPLEGRSGTGSEGSAWGGRALRPRKPRRIDGSGSWNARWDANPWKLKS